MARLVTWGFESQGIEDGGATGGSPPTNSSSVFRSGGFSEKCDSGANVSSYVQKGVPLAAGTYYFRMYYRFDHLPGSTIAIFTVGTNPQPSARLTSAGKLQLWTAQLTGSQVGSDSAATIAADATTWYRIELAMTVSATPQITALELLLDGVSVGSTSGLTLSITLATNVMLCGWVIAPGASKVCYLDDGAINDATGSDQNSWPGSGQVVFLKPTADSAGGSGWTLGTGTALGGNGFLAVDNTPPLGVADLAAGSDSKQIRNAASSANSNYDATLQSYTAAGVPSGATLNVIDPVVTTGAPVTTSAKQGTIGVVSNPAIANVALGAGGTAGAFWSGTTAGTFSTGWKLSHGTATYAPSVTLGTAPVMRITQVTASTRIAMVCSMGIYVDYIGTSANTYTKAGYAKESA